jgi:hypothetical protein
MSANLNVSVKRDELLHSMLKKTDLVIITGTGVSLQSVGYPSQPGTDVAGWPGLLESGVVYCENHRLVSSKGAAIARLLINSPDTTEDLIDAAQKIHGWLEPRTNARIHWIKETIGRLRLYDPSLITAIQNLGGLIATLNYDGLLHEVTKRQPVHWKEQDKIDAHIRTESRDYILHIHGHWEALDSMVLDRTSYDEISKSDKMQQLMQRFARWHTMLFIGCGDTFLDPNFYTLIKWCNTALNGASHRHFILCRQCEEPHFIEMLKPYGFLEPLVYGDSFTDLVPFLNELSNESGTRAAAANPPISFKPTAPAMGSNNIQKASDIWKLQTQR